MVSVSQVAGSYVSSSLPKALMVPVRPKTLKQSKPNHFVNADPRSERALYAKASKGNSGRLCEIGDSEHLVEGREDVLVQTDLYLEELCDLIEEADEECQTDPLLDRPASPLFVPAKIGVDVGTQIYPGELFDYEREVQHVLESLVGQTIEQSLIEVVAEDELIELEKQQKGYEVRRNAEVAEQLRLEEQERRLLEERQKRLKEQEEAVKLEEETAEKIAACIFAQNYLSDLLPKVYRRLEAQGYFVAQDPEIQELEENLWPWLMNGVSDDITRLEASCSLLDSMIEGAVQNIAGNAVIRPVTPDYYPGLEKPSEEDDDSVEDEEKVEGESVTEVEPDVETADE